MSFTFLHTADWQIGKAFGGLPKDVAAALTEARLAAIDRLAQTGLDSGACHVLVAGDMFDGEALAPRTVRQALARMATHSGILWHALPGNHDPHRPGGLWERMLADGLPANIRTHLTAGPVEIEPHVWLLPAPLAGRASSTDPTAHMDGSATPQGALRIGLAHGSVRGFGSDGEASVAIAKTRATTAGLDYLALGDWHGTLRIDAHTWYAGTPEPDRFVGNDAGHALVVGIARKGAAPAVEKRRIGRFVWLRTADDIACAHDLARLEATLAGIAERPSDVLVALTLTGRVTPAERQAIMRRLRGIEASLRHLETDLTQLAVKAGGSDLDGLGGSGDLRRVGERLARLAAEAAPPEAATATQALALLLDLAADAQGPRP